MYQPQPQDIIEGARSIQQHLTDLLGDQAPGVDSELAVLLLEADQGQSVHIAILRVLGRYDSTREWLAEFVRKRRQEEEEAQLKTAQPPPGPITPIGVLMYCCPNGDYQWPQIFVGIPIPPCPNHQIALVPCPTPQSGP